MDIGKLEIVPIRDAFPHEALHFTIWLETNIDALAKQIGLELSVIEREKKVGSFNVDLLCKDDQDNYVIVENQLERSDHDHLGKLITYMVNLEAKIAIWVTPEARPEHQRVIDWLNESTSADYSFYLIQLQAVKIGDSPYAPLFTLLAAPDEQTREIGETKKELAGSDHRCKEFWTGLLEKSKNKTKLFSTISPSADRWISTGSGKAGVNFIYLIFKNDAGIELYIDSSNQSKNKAVFDQLYNQKSMIDEEFGAELTWMRLDNKQSSRIRWTLTDHWGLNDTEMWPQIQDRLIDAMIKFDRTLRPRINNLQI
jgi:hypothetical protein